MKSTLVISIVTFCIGWTTFFQNSGIEGVVTDAANGEPVLFATVALYQNGILQNGTETDLDGKYSFTNLEAGLYDLEFNYVGLKSQRITDVLVAADKLITVDAKLTEDSQMLDEVVVEGYKVPLIEVDNTTSGATITSTSVSKREARRHKRKMRKGLAGKDKNALPTRAINQIAATSAGVSKNGNISVRGSRGQVRQYNCTDGIRVNPENAANLLPRQTLEESEPVGFKFDDTFVEEVSNSEGYEKPAENPFVSPLQEAFSTFSLDVDRASYSNIRRMLNHNQMPPPDAVRVEEMVNYFDYNYEEPLGEHPITVHHNYTSCPWNKDHRLLHLSMKAKEVDTSILPASNLVYLVDVSGSMGSQNKLPLVVKSLKLLVDQLRPEDRVAVVTYAGASAIALPSTSAADKKTIKEGLERLQSGGGTAGAQGIKTAYEIAKNNFIEGGNNRVILATDGDFNIGVSDANGLEKLIEKKRESGIFLSVLGFGMGNYQDHKMQTLANKGNGNHAYIDSYNEAKKVFVNEFAGTLYTVAKDVKIQIEFNAAHVQSYRLIGYENRMLAKEDFNDDKKDAGEVGAGHNVTAIYEIIPAGSASEFSASIDEEIAKKSRTGKQADSSQALGYIKCRYKHPDADKSIKFENSIASAETSITDLDKDIQFSVAVAEFGMNLSQSKFLKTSDLNNCINQATSNVGDDKEGYRQELVELMKKYMSLQSIAQQN